MGHLCVPEARGVILESDLILLLVDAEFAQAVGIGKPAEMLELLKAERRLEFIGNFKKRHASDYSNCGQLLILRPRTNAELSRRKSLGKPESQFVGLPQADAFKKGRPKRAGRTAL